MCVRSHSLCIAGLKAGPTVGEYFGWSCGVRAGSDRRTFIALSIERVSRIIKLPWSSYFSCGAMVQRLARGPFKAEIRVRFPLALPIVWKANKTLSTQGSLPKGALPAAQRLQVNSAGTVLFTVEASAWRRQADEINA